MGAVYEAKDLRLAHTVALKQMLVSNRTLRQAFEREARTLARLDHPALPKVSDYFSDEDGQFLVMPYIPGPDLERLRHQQGHPFPLTDVLRWADELLDALEYLHAHQPPIIHRDIKPANLKLSLRGTIILLDFGLSKGGGTHTTRLNQGAKSVFGYTPHYAPLEQINGTGTNQRSDIYSLGATLYHLLTAAQLPTAITRAQAQLSQSYDPLRPANELNPNVPPAVAAVLAQAMSLNPAQRFASAKAMRAALRHASHSPPKIVAPFPKTEVAVAPRWQEPSRIHTQKAAAPPSMLPPIHHERPTASHNEPNKRYPTWLLPLLGLLLLLLGLIGGGLGAQYLFKQEEPSQSGGIVTTLSPSPTIALTIPLPTVTPPTPTIPVTASATATQSPTAEPVASFQPISLESVANGEFDFVDPPQGDVILGEIAFRLGHVFKSQAAPPPNDTFPVHVLVEMDILQASRLHLLINAGNAFREFEQQKIGEVRAYCNGSSTLLTDLILGRDIREWHASEDKIVSTITRAQEVWQGTRADAPDFTGHIDMLSLDLPVSCQEGRLTAIQLIDTSATTVGSLDPAIGLSGLTVESN
jgi:serine/threonine protein kinase